MSDESMILEQRGPVTSGECFHGVAAFLEKKKPEHRANFSFRVAQAVKLS